ncbi:MAG: hypothetical protein AAFY76_13385 [Cyanobacteria bacterium J06649_11]
MHLEETSRRIQCLQTLTATFLNASSRVFTVDLQLEENRIIFSVNKNIIYKRKIDLNLQAKPVPESTEKRRSLILNQEEI